MFVYEDGKVEIRQVFFPRFLLVSQDQWVGSGPRLDLGSNDSWHPDPDPDPDRPKNLHNNFLNVWSLKIYRDS
jgi:hypothetical protein